MTSYIFMTEKLYRIFTTAIVRTLSEMLDIYIKMQKGFLADSKEAGFNKSSNFTGFKQYQRLKSHIIKDDYNRYFSLDFLVKNVPIQQRKIRMYEKLCTNKWMSQK